MSYGRSRTSGARQYSFARMSANVIVKIACDESSVAATGELWCIGFRLRNERISHETRVPAKVRPPFPFRWCVGWLTNNTKSYFDQSKVLWGGCFGWEEGCPIFVEAVQVSRDSDRDVAFLQVRVCNVGARCIHSIEILGKILRLDGSVDDVGGVSCDIDISPGDSKPLKALELPYSDVQGASVRIIEADNWSSASVPSPIGKLKSISLSSDAKNERDIELQENSIKSSHEYCFEDKGAWWRCSCGEINLGERANCWACGVDKEFIASLSDEGSLLSKAKERKGAEAEKKARFDKVKKKVGKLAAIISVVVAALVAAWFVLISPAIENSSKQASYDQAQVALDSGDYATAYSGFSALEGFNDSSEKAKQVLSAMPRYWEAVKMLNIDTETASLNLENQGLTYRNPSKTWKGKPPELPSDLPTPSSVAVGFVTIDGPGQLTQVDPASTQPTGYAVNFFYDSGQPKADSDIIAGLRDSLGLTNQLCEGWQVGGSYGAAGLCEVGGEKAFWQIFYYVNADNSIRRIGVFVGQEGGIVTDDDVKALFMSDAGVIPNLFSMVQLYNMESEERTSLLTQCIETNVYSTNGDGECKMWGGVPFGGQLPDGMQFAPPTSSLAGNPPVSYRIVALLDSYSRSPSLSGSAGSSFDSLHSQSFILAPEGMGELQVAEAIASHSGLKDVVTSVETDGLGRLFGKCTLNGKEGVWEISVETYDDSGKLFVNGWAKPLSLYLKHCPDDVSYERLVEKYQHNPTIS